MVSKYVNLRYDSPKKVRVQREFRDLTLAKHRPLTRQLDRNAFETAVEVCKDLSLIC
jgi:hypothetical protein